MVAKLNLRSSELERRANEMADKRLFSVLGLARAGKEAS